LTAREQVESLARKAVRYELNGMWTENPVLVSRIVETFEPLIVALDGMEKLLEVLRKAAE
jgi:hypothetical protein